MEWQKKLQRKAHLGNVVVQENISPVVNNRQTDTQTDRHTDRDRDRDKDSQTDRETDRLID